MANQILAGAVVQAGQVIAGVDANNPPYVGPPTVERLLFRSGAQVAQGYAKSINLLDPVTMVSTPLPDPTGVNYGSGRGWGHTMAQKPNGSLFALSQSADYRTASMDTVSDQSLAVYHGSIHIYNPQNLASGPVHTIRHHQDDGVSGRGRVLGGGGMLMTNSHLYVAVRNWYAGPYENDYSVRRTMEDGRIFKYDLSNLSAAPTVIESPTLAATNFDRDNNPYAVGFGNKIHAYGDKIYVWAATDYTGQTVSGNSKGSGGIYVYDADNFATGQHTHYITQQGWWEFGSEMWFDGDDVWIMAPQPNHGHDLYDHDHGQLWKYSLSNLSAGSSLTVNPEDFRGPDGGSNHDRFGRQVVFTDTKIIISSAHEYKDWPQEGYKGYIYIMNKDGSQKQTLTNLPPNHTQEWTVFGRYMKLVAGKLLISRYSPYGQDTTPGGYYPDGNGELWIYDPENLGASPTLWNEAGTVNANEEVIDSEMVVMNLQLPEAT